MGESTMSKRLIENRVMTTCCKQFRLREDICDTRGNRVNCVICRRESDARRYRKHKKKRHALSDKYKKLEGPARDKYLARRKLQWAVKTGKVRKLKGCQLCWRKAVHGHHENYSKPLEVIWVCQRCHTHLHKDEDKCLKNLSK
jgi:hypothetical protein